VRGALHVVEPEGNWWNRRQRMPRVVIGAGSVVEGELLFEREVEMYVHPDARVGRQTGKSPRMIASPDAPRIEQ